MIFGFNSFINESSLKKAKKELHGSLYMSDRKRMRHVLKNNVVTFKFKKKNGEIRRAVGTLHSSYLPALKGGAPKPERQMVYYDIEKGGWRSYRSFSFIKILDIVSVEKYEKPHKHKEKEKPEPIKHHKPEPEEKLEKKIDKKIDKKVVKHEHDVDEDERYLKKHGFSEEDHDEDETEK